MARQDAGPRLPGKPGGALSHPGSCGELALPFCAFLRLFVVNLRGPHRSRSTTPVALQSAFSTRNSTLSLSWDPGVTLNPSVRVCMAPP